MSSAFIELRNIQKQYRLGQVRVRALCGATLELHQGEFAALIGASGSGKSTLLNILGCIDDPDSGQVILEGNDVAEFSDAKKGRLRNEKIGFIFQSFNLVPVLNVYENIELPLLIHSKLSVEEKKHRVLSIIEEVGLTEHIKHRPDQLSGGQRQRVAIARALVTEPMLILADEPTANLDSVTTHKIIELMQELNRRKKITFLFSTHDEKLMSKVTRILRIEDGIVYQ